MPSDEESEALDIIAAAIEPFATPEPALVAQLYRGILRVDPLATPQEIAAKVTEKGPSKRQPGMVYFLTAVSVCFPLRRKPVPASETPLWEEPAPLEERIEDREKLLKGNVLAEDNPARKRWVDELRELYAERDRRAEKSQAAGGSP